ncbi:glycosyltransferase family 1 protein [Virgibacillus sp. DJP39]|uniref:glycosyltransferase family 1 protein n=1 Tax=Virgibacillus sp. DJP39 TaxID=3409790 RepID=UPI003BB726D3
MGDPLKILHVVVNMNRGGAETLIMNLYRNMDRKKVQFDFLTCKEGVFDTEIREMGGIVHRIPYLTEVGHFGYLRELDRFLEANSGYKIIHSHMDKMSGLVLRAAKKANVPIRIAHSHNTSSEGTRISKIYKWYAGRHILPNATQLYACSRSAAEWLYGNKSKNTVVLKNGIEPDGFQYKQSVRESIRKELKLDPESFVIGHVGRFATQKNHQFLLDVFAEVRKNLPNAVLILAGDGPLKAEISEKAKKLKIDSDVKILGIREDINILLQAFDIVVFPSLHEGLPVTLIEAQGAGLPCMISDKVTREVDMEIGLVQSLPLTNLSTWVNAIVERAQNLKSRKITRNALSQKGYDIRKTAALTETSYLALGSEVI